MNRRDLLKSAIVAPLAAAGVEPERYVFAGLDMGEGRDRSMSDQTLHGYPIVDVPTEDMRLFEGTISKLTLGPDDMIVIQSPMRISDKAHARISELLTETFPGRKILMFEDGMTIGVLSPVDTKERT